MSIMLIIAGSRSFNDYERLKTNMQLLGLEDKDVTIISGTAQGADKLGERWAEEFNKPVIRMPADWNKYGRSAGYRRNVEMAKIATHLVAFWDGSSRGTGHMIDIAHQYALKQYIVPF